jgi:membrane protein
MYGDLEDDDGGGDMPSEFPERWSKFLPVDDIRARLHTTRENGRENGREGGRDSSRDDGRGSDGEDRG